MVLYLTRNYKENSRFQVCTGESHQTFEEKMSPEDPRGGLPSLHHSLRHSQEQKAAQQGKSVSRHLVEDMRPE
jgi:hypothetical protein